VNLRELKGLEIAARTRIIWRDGAWLVPSQSGQGKYRVQLSPGVSTCTCEDFQLRQEPCKHIYAVRLAQERDRGEKAPPIDTEVVPKRPTYPQNWPAYNLAQTIEKRRFQQLLHDLCQGIPEPPLPKCGRRPHLAKDCIFAMVYKVYSTFSSRRFHCDLADAYDKGYLSRPISGMKVCHFFKYRELAPVLEALIMRSSLPLRVIETTFAADSTGFSTGRFVRWHNEKYGSNRSGHDWVKVHVISGTKTNVVTSVQILERDAGDCPQLKALVGETAENFQIDQIYADKAYLSHENLALAERVGAVPFIPFKSNSSAGPAGSLWERAYLYYQLHREEFLKRYHQRSNVESTFAMVKAKFRDNVRSKTDVAMKIEVLCKFLAHNLCVLIQSQCELGIEPVFWHNSPAESTGILSINQRG
jgi:transposase